MNPRRKNLFWIVVIGLALAVVTGLVMAQPPAQLTDAQQTQTSIAQDTRNAPTVTSSPGPTPTPSATPLLDQEIIQPYSLTTLYGQPSAVYTDLGGDLYACQNPAQTVASSPSDITRIEVYVVPDNFASLSGYLIAAYTETPFEQLLSEYSTAMLFRSATIGGQTEHRINEVHEQTFRVGVINNNNQLIDDTTQLASVSPDGMAAVFNVPETVSQFQLTSYYTAQAGQNTTCDVAPNNGLFDLHAAWADPAQWATTNPLVSGSDELEDTVVCGVGGAANGLDINEINVYPAPANAPFPNGYVVEVRNTRESGVQFFNEIRYLHVERAEVGAQDWLMGDVNGRHSSRVQNEDNVIDYQANRWGDYSRTSDDQVNTIDFFNIPGDVNRIQVRTAQTVEQGGQQVCDQYPSDGSWIDLSPTWMSSIVPANLVTTIEDPAGDTVDAATGASVNAPDADITRIDILNPGDGSPSILVVPHTALDLSFNRNITATFLRGSGEWYRVTLEQSGGQTATDVQNSDGAAIYTPGRVAGFFDVSSYIGAFSPTETDIGNWAAGWTFGLFPVDTTHVTITTQVTMAGGQTVIDTTDPIDVPAGSGAVTYFPTCARDLLTIAAVKTARNQNVARASGAVIDSAFAPMPGAEAGTINNPLVLKTECDDPAFAAPTIPPIDQTYGAPVQTLTDPAGDPADCQTQAPSAGTTPSDIASVSIHRIPDNVLSDNGYLIAVDTIAPFRQIVDSANSAAVVVNAVTATGARANRRVQIHEGQESSGIIDDNNQLVAGTGDFVGFDAAGRALFLVPPTTTQAQITSYYMSAAGQPTICDSTETINFAASFSDGTLGNFYDSLGIVVCPPLDGTFELDMPIDQQSADALRLGLLLLTPRQSGNSRYLVLTDPSRPYHPLFNPAQLRDSCIEPFSVASPLADVNLFEAVDALGITLCPPLTVANEGDSAWEALMIMMGSETGSVEVSGTHLELRDPAQPYDADSNPIEWKNDCTPGIPAG